MNPSIQIIRGFRLEGHVEYREGNYFANFGFEVGMDDSCGIGAPSGMNWDLKFPWLAGRREEVLTAIGREFLHHEFPSHKLRITEHFLWIIP